MTTVVLLVLAIIWAALLISWFRSRAVDTSNADTVGMFRRHLTVLGKASPATAYAANRNRERRAAERSSRDPFAPRPAMPVRGGAAPVRTGTRPQRPVAPRPVSTRPASAQRRRAPSAQQAVLRRRQAQRRRRDIFFALLAGVAGSLALALVPGLRIMWPVQVIFDFLFIGYVALLMRIRNRAAERDLKLRFLPQAQSHLRPVAEYELAGAGAGGRYEYDYGYDAGGTYEYDLRQAIN